MSIYYEKYFSSTHELLKQYGCKQTFSFEEEYYENSIWAGFNFYKPESEMHNDTHKSEWDEKVDAALDVVVPTKWEKALKNQIRFDIEYSDRAKLYSMYISLPTSGRSISLSKKNFKTQDEIIAEICKWSKMAKCKKGIKEIRKQAKDSEQLSMF